MNVNLSLGRSAALVAGALVVLSGTMRAAETDALPSFDSNYIKVSGVLPDVSGSRSAFERRAQYSKDGAGGIEAFNYTQELSKATSYQVDGKLLPGAADYLAQFKITKNEVGSFEAGYKRFRTFYDGVGGFFPLNNAWLPIYTRSRYVDRGKLFVNATINLPKQPVFTFSYTNELRNGTKDSTIWGDTDQTGIPIWSLSSLNPVTSARKILPAYIQLGERQQNWEATARHTVGNTTATLSANIRRINNLDTRSIDRYTGELKPFPAIPSNPPTLVPPLLANNANKGFDQQGFKENGFSLTGKIENVINEKMTAYIGGVYLHSSNDIAASRLVTGPIATATGTVAPVGSFITNGRPPYSYNSTGALKMDVWTGNIGVQTKVTNAFLLDVALRGEDMRTSGHNDAVYVNNYVNQATGTVTPSPVAAPNSLKIHEKPWTPAVDARYTGISNVSLYASWDYRTVSQDERTIYSGITPGGTVINGTFAADTQAIKEHHTNVKLGANWTPNSVFSLRPEVFTKDHENRFTGYGVSAGDYFILDYDIYGARLSAILRPLATLTLNTRYLVQRGKAAISDEGHVKGDSNDSRRTQLCETIDWAPTKAFYVQGNVNLVYDRISTAYPRVTGVAKDVLRNADNNYWNGSVGAVFAVDKQTDAQIQSTYYKANNYNPALAAATVPFGAGGKEYTITVGVKHKFTDRWVGSAKAGYFESRNDTTGGNTNFHGPLAYLSLEHAF